MVRPATVPPATVTKSRRVITDPCELWRIRVRLIAATPSRPDPRKTPVYLLSVRRQAHRSKDDSGLQPGRATRPTGHWNAIPSAPMDPRHAGVRRAEPGYASKAHGNPHQSDRS